MSVYITPGGAKRLSDELIELRTKKRPKIVQEVADAAAQGDRSENAEYIYGKKKLREIDRRIHFLVKRLDVIIVVDPTARPKTEQSRIFFGATVDVEDEDGKKATYQIVGEDEIDLTPSAACHRISLKSPLAQALMKKTAGDVTVVKRPAGEMELSILAVRYV
jgi:transcription elongation factor GreB